MLIMLYFWLRGNWIWTKDRNKLSEEDSARRKGFLTEIENFTEFRWEVKPNTKRNIAKCKASLGKSFGNQQEKSPAHTQLECEILSIITSPLSWKKGLLLSTEGLVPEKKLFLVQSIILPNFEIILQFICTTLFYQKNSIIQPVSPPRQLLCK